MTPSNAVRVLEILHDLEKFAATTVNAVATAPQAVYRSN
jgi:hypothetical protein